MIRISEVNEDFFQLEMCKKLSISFGDIKHYINTLVANCFAKFVNLSPKQNKFVHVRLLKLSGIAKNAGLFSFFIKLKIGKYVA
jgi:hypothetical protein